MCRSLFSFLKTFCFRSNLQDIAAAAATATTAATSTTASTSTSTLESQKRFQLESITNDEYHNRSKRSFEEEFFQSTNQV
jgi:hypothetical protein